MDRKHPKLSVSRQCRLLSISRSGLYYEKKGESALNLALMRRIDEQYLNTPWYGSRQMARCLQREGYAVGRKRVRRLMRLMGLRGGRRARLPAAGTGSTGFIRICCGTA